MSSSRLARVLLVAAVGACTGGSQPASDAGACPPPGSTRSPLCDGARLVATLPFPVVRLHADGDKLLVLVDPDPAIGHDNFSPDLYEVAIAGGAPSLVVTGLDAASYDDATDGFPDLGFDATSAYVGKGGVAGVPLAGGPPTSFPPTLSTQRYEGVAAAGGRAFFKTWDPANPSCVDVASASTDPSQPSASYLLLQTCAGPKAGVADGYVYLWDPFDGGIYRVPSDSTVTQTTPESVGATRFARALAYDAPDWIYAIHDSAPYELDWFPKVLGAPGAGSVDVPNNGVIAADATGVYLMGSAIERLSPGSATVQSVFPDPGTALALDATSIYFADGVAIYAIAKPGA